ncbi:Leucine-rich repeat [Dillenia turbinata]|uniref:Leucine-rich repeat n=1 Tax=Dillenia turbinata TaxID=194707 RepID=A0AAN8ZPY5_9MAGN
MDKKHLWLVQLVAIVISAILTNLASASTNPLDVETLHELYKALDEPSQLKGWSPDGGDPCEESWTGISCSGSSSPMTVIRCKYSMANLVPFCNHCSDLHGLELGGTLRSQLINLRNLEKLNVSYNSLAGPIGDVFGGLQNLKELDLSYNDFSGDLPSSFGSLPSLKRLFLQNNQLTGSVIFLANLPLAELIGGNKFHEGATYPPWDFPFDKKPNETNSSSPLTNKSNAVESHPYVAGAANKKKRLGPGGVAVMVVGGALIVTCAAVIFALRLKQAREQKLRLESSEISECSLPVSTVVEGSTIASEEIPQLISVTSPFTPKAMPPLRLMQNMKMGRRKSFSKKCRIPVSAKLYTVEELQSATNSFNEENLIGEGSLGSVYKAEFPDGRIFAVKNISMVSLSLYEEEQFLDVIWTVARLRHPNIVTLLGYCVEHGQHLLVYEFVRSLSLDAILHCKEYKPLSWGFRLQIALGVAQALDYLHFAFSPPMAHCNLKADNILIDDELVPRITDCGLAVLRPLTSNSVKLKASEMAINSAGYIAPEHGNPGVDNTKTDIYAFGVLLLELLTGRRPFDSSLPREEQSLVKWASSMFHDIDSLLQIVDPGLKRSISPGSVSRFANIISLCIQPEKEFRPVMSEIVESLKTLTQKPGTSKAFAAEGAEIDLDRSFRSSHTRFLGSPALSH